MPTQAAPDNKQKANITTAIENTGCPSIALDEAAPIICTKVLAALMDPMISGICRRASFVAHGKIKPNDNATPTITNTTTRADLPPIRSRYVARIVESASSTLITCAGDSRQPLSFLLPRAPAMADSELAPKITPYSYGLRHRASMKNRDEPVK